MVGESLFSPIHTIIDTKVKVSECEPRTLVRQRSHKNSSQVGTSDISNPITPESTDIHDAPQRFSFACKRLTRVVVCASLYIVLFSSRGTRVNIYDVDKRFVSSQNQRKDGKNMRKNRRSRHATPSRNQIPIPDFDFLSSSGDDSGDDSEDGADDGGDGGVKNAINTRDYVGESCSNPLLDHGGDGARKKVRPSLAFAKSSSSTGILGAPKPKRAQDPVIYQHHESFNEIADVSLPHDDGHLLRKNDSQDQSLLNFRLDFFLPNLNQNGVVTSQNSHVSESQGKYENIGGGTTNQISICLAWFFPILFMMEAGYCEIKRRIRSQKLREFLDYSLP